MYFSTSYFCPLLKPVSNTLLSTRSETFTVSARFFIFTTVYGRSSFSWIVARFASQVLLEYLDPWKWDGYVVPKRR